MGARQGAQVAAEGEAKGALSNGGIHWVRAVPGPEILDLGKV